MARRSRRSCASARRTSRPSSTRRNACSCAQTLEAMQRQWLLRGSVEAPSPLPEPPAVSTAGAGARACARAGRVSGAEIEDLVQHCPIVLFAPAEPLLQQGAPGTSMFLLVRGKSEVARRAHGERGRRSTCSPRGIAWERCCCSRARPAPRPSYATRDLQASAKLRLGCCLASLARIYVADDPGEHAGREDTPFSARRCRGAR